jgi:hypothetical protein
MSSSRCEKCGFPFAQPREIARCKSQKACARRVEAREIAYNLVQAYGVEGAFLAVASAANARVEAEAS